MQKLVLLVCLFSFPGTLFGMDNDLKVKQKSLNDELLKAAEECSLEEIKTLLDNGADVNAQNKRGLTALMLAVYLGKTDYVKFLVDTGADINAQNNIGWTALMMAAKKGDVASVKILLNAGADVNTQDCFYYTALLKAADKGDVDCVKNLLAAGSDINAHNQLGYTALLKAAHRCHVDCVKILASPWSLSGARERINVVRALLRERLGAVNYHLHAKILLSAKELEENVILMLLGEVNGGNKKVFLDPVFSLVKSSAFAFLNKQLETCKKIYSDLYIKDEIRSLCSPDDIEKMKERISEYEAQVRYNDNEK